MSKISYFEKYHQILFWPLEIPEDPCDQESRALPGWERLNPLERGTNSDPQTPYQEFVYFHPFAQQFLYPEKDGRFTLQRRTDVKRVRIEFYQDPPEVLDVDRVHLYQFQQHQVAILVIEVSAKRSISREAVLLLEDRFRRIYPPFWNRNGGLDPEWEGGHCPKSVEWLDANGARFLDGNGKPDVDAKSDYDNPGAMMAAVARRRSPVSSHWRWLLKPFKDYTQIEDDRAPSMVFLMHENPPLITRGDLIRHCFYDGPGSEEGLPYSEGFLKNFERDFAYTRFWKPDPSPTNWLKTSYTCCGYGFTVIAAAGSYGEALLEHFRNHYFQIGLLAHFHRAALLRFSNRFNQVMNGAEDDKQYERLLAERTEFGRFISSSWFHEASNQDQGRELFEFWSNHLRTEQLMRNILTEAEAVDAVLSDHERRRLKRADDERDKRSNELAERIDKLTVLLYLVAGATLIVALLDTEAVRNLIRNEPAGRHIETPWFWKWSVFWGAITGLAMSIFYHQLMKSDKAKRKQFFPLTIAALILVALLALGLALYYVPAINQLFP